MLRRILACLAILTGLATTAAPAQARMMAVMSQSVVEGSQSAQGNNVAACEQVQQRQDVRSKAATLRPCKPTKPVVIVIPTIQLGPDRALE